MDGWKTSFRLGWLPGRCYVSFREGIYLKSIVFSNSCEITGHKIAIKLMLSPKRQPPQKEIISSNCTHPGTKSLSEITCEKYVKCTSHVDGLFFSLLLWLKYDRMLFECCNNKLVHHLFIFICWSIRSLLLVPFPKFGPQCLSVKMFYADHFYSNQSDWNVHLETLHFYYRCY